jgi:hypothetical protein
MSTHKDSMGALNSGEDWPSWMFWGAIVIFIVLVLDVCFYVQHQISLQDQANDAQVRWHIQHR